jgi:hypothetical protein
MSICASFMSDLQQLLLAVAGLHPGSIGLLVNRFNRRSPPFEPTTSQVFLCFLHGCQRTLEREL